MVYRKNGGVVTMRRLSHARAGPRTPPRRAPAAPARSLLNW
ncbi:hypothetical protein MYA_5951 [Burkholderia sp. KJ006]|nr:hypothetical protein MYA_5951 [Burkholderia sp. KJ006]